jgi:hypothetical protein
MDLWIASLMKTKREQACGDLLVIKLFASNYARDLILSFKNISSLTAKSITIAEDVSKFSQESGEEGELKYFQATVSYVFIFLIIKGYSLRTPKNIASALF